MHHSNFHFQVAIESVLLIEDPKVARQVMFQNPPAKVRMVSKVIHGDRSHLLFYIRRDIEKTKHL